MAREFNGKPTINDVARQADVSRQTVSNVLNAPQKVRLETREKVQRAIDSLGYRIHQSARRLRTQQSSTIGVRLDADAGGISGAVLDRFLHALTERCSQLGLRVLLYTVEDSADDIAQISRLIDDGDVDAFVLTSTVHNDPRIAWLWEHDFPFASFGRPWGDHLYDTPTIRWADVDGRYGTHAATQGLIDRGLEIVGYIGWPTGSGTGDERAQGWHQAMTERADRSGSDHLMDIESLHVIAEDNTAAGSRATRSLLGRHPDIQAIVCASDTLALGATLVTKSRLPVVGFDDTPVARAVEFSSVRQPIGDVAHAVLGQLGYGIERPPSQLLLPPTVQWRLG